MKSVILVNDNSNRKSSHLDLDTDHHHHNRQWSSANQSMAEPFSHSGLSSSIQQNRHLNLTNDNSCTYHHHHNNHHAYHHSITNTEQKSNNNHDDHHIEGSILRFINPPSTSASYNLIKSDNQQINNHRSYPNLSTAIKQQQVFFYLYLFIRSEQVNQLIFFLLIMILPFFLILSLAISPLNWLRK